MLYIISFQSISCREASPTSPRPHKGPPEWVSIGHPLNLPPGFPHVAQLSHLAGLPLNLPPGFPHVAQLCPLAGLPLNLPPGFPHVAQLCPLAGLPLNLPPGFPHVAQLGPLAGPSKQFSSRPERRFSIGPSGLPRKAVWAVPVKALRAGHNPVFSDGVSPDLPCSPSACPSPRPPCPQVLQCHPHVPNNPTISLKPASNRTSTGPRHGHPAHKYLSGIPAWQSRHLSSLRHGHPAHKPLSAIPACRDVPKPVSERCSERFLRRSSDRLSVRARLSRGRGEKEVGKCLEFRNLRLL